MTQVYDANNELVPVTVVKVDPCSVVQIKTVESDGYNAIQFASMLQKKERIAKPQQGHFSKAGIEPHHRLCEFRTDKSDFSVGDKLTVACFQEGQKVDVIGNTKGRGFQGVVKRWGFSGGKASHGSMFHRRGGSYGQCQWPGEVDKGRKMPGHMGNARRTSQNLVVVKVIEDKNLLLIKGSFPGPKGGEVFVREAKKVRKAQS